MEEYQATPEEANLEMVKGTLERARWKPERFNDDELRAFFRASEKTIEELRKNPEEEEKLNKTKIAFGICYDEIIKFIKYYMDLPEEYTKIIAVWVLGTYLHEAFEVYPYLFINAMRGSGKTRLLKIISHLSCRANGEVHTGLTESVFFRTPAHHTLVIDEFEGVAGKNKADLREYLNASYKRGGVVQRMKKIKDKEGENYKIDTFQPFKPIAMANIWGMDEVLGDRCITLILQKSNNPSKTKKAENFHNNPSILNIKRTLEQNDVGSVCRMVKIPYKEWNTYIDNRYTIHPTYILQPTLPTLLTLEQEEMFLRIDKTEIEGRNLELLFPLLITARLLNFETFEEILDIGNSLLEKKKEDELIESKDVSLISFIAQLPSSYNFDYKLQIELKREFTQFIGEVDDNFDKWLTSEWFGRALKRLDLVLDKRRKTRGNEITLNIAKAKEKLKMFKREEND